MTLSFDAREVTMHYKRKGERVDDVLHNIVLDHVNNLEQENKRLREALKYYADKEHYEPYCLAVGDYASDVTEDSGMIARIALEGDSNA